MKTNYARPVGRTACPVAISQLIIHPVRWIIEKLYGESCRSAMILWCQVNRMELSFGLQDILSLQFHFSYHSLSWYSISILTSWKQTAEKYGEGEIVKILNSKCRPVTAENLFWSKNTRQSKAHQMPSPSSLDNWKDDYHWAERFPRHDSSCEGHHLTWIEFAFIHPSFQLDFSIQMWNGNGVKVIPLP